ncbi:fumarylacetoacetate hydrolase family protein [Cohnella hashimotonis]|uniref:Fumarylacetoacetate hydrolase family protein n=1 Tax=Cohnella hashimotonis TaxID=2826895 RepID=A0ABT6TKJ1_9BACL|nr:fumarylacetoacetate hydrolase family protein [Cohnella hashimotonis]MDI4647372.1 fumarylacetoacetate hydrolase family protein [Cohnella hashimotonis]
MKLLTFMKGHQRFLGIHTHQGVLSVSDAIALTSLQDADLPLTVMAAIKGGPEAVSGLQFLVDRSMASAERDTLFLDEAELTWGPCVTEPGKIVCVGLNYRKHAEESKMPIPTFPILFNKFNNTLTGHKQEVLLPKESAKVDYEAELAIVIGSQVKDVTKEMALDYVFGYCSANDLSARDLQMRTNQWLLGKSCDGFCPIGPYLVTADEVGNANDLTIKCSVNGELRQYSNTSDMIFHCDEIVSYVSRHMTLEPGDIILTGTPEGVVFGYPEDRQVWLKDGDIVTIDIDKLGSLTTRVVAEA